MEHQVRTPAFDQGKYNFWFEAAAAGEYTPTCIKNRREIAQLLDISTQTVDNLIMKGAPSLSRGRGGPAQIDAPPFIEFYMANRAGITVTELRQILVREMHDACVTP